MPSRTGTASQVAAWDNINGAGSTSVTVPSDASYAVAFWSFFNETDTTLTTLTLAGDPFAIRTQLGTPSEECGCGIATLANPTTGSQTLAWQWSQLDDINEGGWIVVVWVKDHNTSTPARDWEVAADIEGNYISVTIDSAVTDLLLAFCQSFSDANPSFSNGGPWTTFIDNAALRSELYDIGEGTSAAGSTLVDMNGRSFSTIGAISLPSAAVEISEPTSTQIQVLHHAVAQGAVG